MATTQPQRTGSNAPAAPTFSYAQAAKRTASAPSSKPASGAVTPAKDQQVSATSSAEQPKSWADDVEANDARPEPTVATNEARTQPSVPASKPAPMPQAPEASQVSSPDLGASSASTVVKDDDVSSIPNTSSDSTWDNKSQASTSVEKSVGSLEKLEKGDGKKAKAKGKNAEKDKAPAKPLTEAPVPAVNIWKQRAEEAKAKAVQRPAPAKSASTTNGAPNGPAAKSAKPASDVNGSKEKSVDGESRVKGQEDKGRKDFKPESEPKKTTKGRPLEKDARVTAPALPAIRDQEAWPTPDIAVDEDRKKANEKTDKAEPEHKDSTAPKTKWSKLPINPTVVFNTPMPNGATSRRGGRGPGRGGAQVGGRPGFDAGNAPHADKDGAVGAVQPNGDVTKRGRVDGPVRDASPREKRITSSGPKDKAPTVNGEKPTKAAGSDGEAPSKPATDFQSSGPNNTIPRQYPTGRPNKGRRGDFGGQERRKDGNSVPPSEKNGAFNGRRNSNPQAEVPENAEQRPAGFTDGQVPHPKRGSDRQFGSFSGRDARRGGRGGRGNYQNGHQFANGHNPSMKQSFSGPLSPTAFNPDPNAFFTPSHNARYRNGPRSQSVANENMFRMPGPFGGPQQVPPLQTYMNAPPYDYPMAQPMSAVPYGQFGMDPFSIFSMVTMQMEYYFSLENLLKDMYLRKHMDAKGFVFLSFIADFNRIKQLTTDLELIKSVCYQSRAIDFRIGADGKERLRCKENWEQWVLPVADRDSTAQNEGPEETFNPPVPHPHGFENQAPRFPDMPASAGPMFGGEGAFPAINGFYPGATQHVSAKENLQNGTVPESVNGVIIPNGHPVDSETKA